MVSIDGLLDAHEVGVRSRVEGLREQAVRVAAELAAAELALEHVAITRATLAVVVAGGGDPARPGQGVDAPVPVAGKGPVPVWRPGLTGGDLPDGYRPVWEAVVQAAGPLRAGEVAGLLGRDRTSTTVEGLRYRLKRLVAAGWLSELASAAFTASSAAVAVSPAGGS